MEIFLNLTKSYEKILEVLQALQETAKMKLEVLKKNDVDTLGEIVQKQNVLTKEISTLEQDLLKSQNELATTLGLKEFTLEGIRAKVDTGALEDYQNRVISKVAELKHSNSLNEMILKQNLAYVQSMVQTLNQITNQANNQVYSQKGQIKKEEKSNSLLNKRV